MKKLFLILFCLTLGAGLGGCSQSESSLSAEKLAAELVEQGVFETGFIRLEEDQLESFYPGVGALAKEAAVYESDSQILELVAVIQTDDPQAATALLKQRQDYLLRQAENYFPEQTEKIENAVLTVKDDCVVLVISADSQKAEEIIKDAK